jgi:hypothetical protein
MDKYDIYKRADLAAEEAFQAAVSLIGTNLQLNQELGMDSDYPPAFLVTSSELEAQTICAITTHKKKDNLVLRIWSPFETRRVNNDGVGVRRKQDYTDFLYNNGDSWENNANEIARLIWHYYHLLMDWHMSYASDMEGFDLDLDEEY